MADAAAQREARRRKITQNAEARMNRLLGLQDGTQKEKEPPQESVPIQEENDSEAHSSPYNLRHRPQKPSTHASTSGRSSPASISSTTERNDNSIHEPKPSSPLVQENNSGAKAAEEDHKSASSVHNVKDSSVTGKDFDAHSLEILKLALCIGLAFLSRFLLKFGLGLFIIPSIFIPFIVMEAALTYIIHTHLPHISLPYSKGSLMSAALMLCGIKQELMEVHQKIMSYVSAFTNDLCLFVFSFIIWNLIIV